MQRRTKALLMMLVIIVGVAFAYRVRFTLMPFALACVIAYLLNPLVCVFERKKVPRNIAILISYMLLAVSFILVYFAVVPPMMREMNELMTQLPGQAERFEGMAQTAVRDVQRLPLPNALQGIVELALHRVEELMERLATRMADTVVQMFSGAAILILAPFLAYYILRDLPKLQARALDLIPKPYRAHTQAIAREVNYVVGSFLRGQLLVSLLIGLFISVGLALLRVKYAFLVGMLAGLFDIIPYFGPIIGSIPAVALGFIRSPITAVYVVALIFLAHQMESVVLSPKIVGDRVGLHPLAVIFAVLAGGELFGLVGMLVAVPAAASVRVVLDYWSKKG